jgi:putative ABC transport system permease protein
MMLTTSLRIARKALNQNKLRTGLAILGMTIGVAAVLTMFALGTGAQQSVSSDLKSAGTTLIFVRSGNFTRGGEESRIPTGLGAAHTLTPEDAQAIGKIPGVRYAAGWVMERGWVETANERYFTQVIGADTAFPDMYGWTFAKGKFYKPADVASAASVVVIGTSLRDRLFGDESPIGKTVNIHNQPFRVVGVFAPKDDNDQAEMVLMPYTSLQKLIDRQALQGVTVASEQAGQATEVATSIKVLLRQRHRLDAAPAGAPPADSVLGGNQAPSTEGGVPDDFTVKTQAAEALTKGLYTSVAAFVLANMPQVDQANLQEMSGTLNRAGKTMTALLAAIATISLIVGGVGIMNIMLVSVTERTREIGIRRAVGARAKDVRQQFLVEAVSLALIGGAFGIIGGFLVALLVTYVLDWPASISLNAVFLGFGIASLVGVAFGFYPAQRASRLDPIDALRYE